MEQHTPRPAAHHHGRVKWFNGRSGYGFIHDLVTGKDVFVHNQGLTRRMQKNPPREGDVVTFTVARAEKGPEAVEVDWKDQHHRPPPPPRHTRSTATAGQGHAQAKIFACIHTAKVIAGEDHLQLRRLIPLLLQHNGLPTIQVPLQAFISAGHTPLRRRSKQPEEDTHIEQRAEEANPHNPPAEAESSESESDAASSCSEDEDEDEAEGKTAPRYQIGTPVSCHVIHHSSSPSTTAAKRGGGSHSSHKQTTAAETHPSPSQTIAADDGWVTKEKRQRRAKRPPADAPPRPTPSTSTKMTTRAQSSNTTDTADVQYVVRTYKFGKKDVKPVTPVGVKPPHSQ